MYFCELIAESCETFEIIIGRLCFQKKKMWIWQNNCQHEKKKKEVIYEEPPVYKASGRECMVNIKPHTLTSRCPLLQSVHSFQEEFTPFSDSTTRSPSTPSHPFVGRSMSPSLHPASLWMGINSLSSRWDLTSRAPSSALSSTTSGTSLLICTTVIGVRHWCGH